jgi:hypothetical protein
LSEPRLRHVPRIDETLAARFQAATSTSREGDWAEVERRARAAARSHSGGAAGPEPRPPAALTRLIGSRWARFAALAVALGVGFGFGIGFWLTPRGSATSSFLGFGFLPSKGWTVVQTGAVGATGTAHAIAANVAVAGEDGSTDLPYTTLRRLPRAGAVVVARLFPRGNQSRDASFPLRPLPLSIADAVPEEPPFELSDTPLVAFRVRAAVAGYDVDARIFLGGAPSPATLAAVDEQLRRLVVAPSGITLVVLPTIISDPGQRMTIYGSVSSGKAGEKVTVQFKACGLLPLQFRDAFETTTTAGGGYSFAQLRPFNLGVSGVYRALSGGDVSAETQVQQRAAVYLRPRPGGRFQVAVGGKVSFWRRYVLLQRFERRRGVWITMRRIVLDEGWDTPPFRPALPKGTQIRAALPLSQARPCYLAGYSPIRTTS